MTFGLRRPRTNYRLNQHNKDFFHDCHMTTRSSIIYMCVTLRPTRFASTKQIALLFWFIFSYDFFTFLERLLIAEMKYIFRHL